MEPLQVGRKRRVINGGLEFAGRMSSQHILNDGAGLPNPDLVVIQHRHST